MASIKKRGDAWLVRIANVFNPNTGKTGTHTHTVRGTLKDAKAYATKVERDRDLGLIGEPSKMSVGAYLDRWLSDGDRARPSTSDHHAYFVSHYIKPVLGEKQLGRLSPLEIQGFYSHLSKRGLSPATIRRIHGLLSAALRRAKRLRLINDNPASEVDLPKLTKKEMRSLTVAEAQRFMETAQCDRYAALWAFALETGMRPGEYLALRWSDVDLDTGTATVQRSLVWRKDGQFEFSPPKTAKSRRKVPLSPGLVLELKAHKKAQAEERMATGPAWKDQALVFAASNGGPIRRENLTKRHFKPLLKAAKLPDIRLYDLRHCTATLLLAKGVNPKVVAERLGHSSITLTLDTYSHVLPDIQEQATNILGDLLFGSS